MISIQSLDKRYGANRALSGVSLEIEKGGVAALIGPSGSGKSTLIRCINGLEPFDAGTIRVGDHTLVPGLDARRDADLLARVRRAAGMVFQSFNLFPHLDVLRNLTLAPTVALGERASDAEARARAVLDRVGLAAKARAMPADLSGGQQQRVAIARALLMKPDALLFDEPTSALDPRSAMDVLGLMAELASEGQTMIVVTHALGFARRVAKEVHVLDEGRIIESGPPARVLDAPDHEVTQALLASERG